MLNVFFTVSMLLMATMVMGVMVFRRLNPVFNLGFDGSRWLKVCRLDAEIQTSIPQWVWCLLCVVPITMFLFWL